MKRILTFAAALLALAAQAAPFLQTAAPYPFPANYPQSAYTFSAVATPGPFSLTCTVQSGKPMCDAAPALAVPVPSLSFVLTVTRTAGCDATGATCWTGGSAPSVPFVRTLSDLPVGAATGLLLGP